MGKRKAIPIIDLFAGPGGLGEGFISVVDSKGERHFRIALSIEKDDFAHETLTLRNFTRQFPFRKLPAEYYDFVRGNITIDKLYSLYPKQAEEAKREAWKTTLGETPHDIVDQRIREALNGAKDFIVIGGPPCQAYSLVGRARRQQAEGLNKNDPRVYLYREYYRILAVHSPSVFIMENVKGLLSSKVDNEHIFQQLIADLENPVASYKKLHGEDNLTSGCPGYTLYSLVKMPSKVDVHNKPVFKPSDFIIHAEDYGIPQTRHRVILLGIRNDLKKYPGILREAAEHVDIRRVLSGLPKLRSGLSKQPDGNDEWKQALRSFPKQLKQEIDKDIYEEISKTIDNITAPILGRGKMYVSGKVSSDYEQEWYLDNMLNGISNHETRGHIVPDLHRYVFAACFAKLRNRSPKLADFPQSLLPDHDNVSVGVSENKFADRFRVQLYGHPSKTVTSHISKDGHYFIHPDATQSRSLTVREAARIQTFPDNYYFCGPRTSQYTQVGNAVPPLLAKQIANVVLALL